MDFQVKPYSKCPCGSGKPYIRCHSPIVDKNRSDNNHWRGPGFDQSIYFGQDDIYHGLDFKIEDELVLFEKDTRYPLCSWFTIDESILSYKAIVKELNIIHENGQIIYSGVIEVDGDPSKLFPILVGTGNDDPRNQFKAFSSSGPLFIKRNNWLGFIDADSNPFSSIQERPHWFRFFLAHGFLIKSKPGEELHFELSARTMNSNIFTMCLPFHEIDLSCPKIIVDAPSVCDLEIERENIYWDLILCKSIFDEARRRQKDSRIFVSTQENNTIKFIDFKKDTRIRLNGPNKIRINLFSPSCSSTIGKFGPLLENILRGVAEHSSFDFNVNANPLLEENFRDSILKAIKSLNYFASAETTRRDGFIDILIKYSGSETIIEFKVWGRPNYKNVVRQVISYGTAWTIEYATVMINPNKGSICSKFVSNAKKSPGFINFPYIENDYQPVQKLISYHYNNNWERSYIITHFIVNLELLKSPVT